MEQGGILKGCRPGFAVEGHLQQYSSMISVSYQTKQRKFAEKYKHKCHLYLNGMCYIGQMVAKALQIRCQIDKHAAGFRLTFSLVQPLDMTIDKKFP